MEGYCKKEDLQTFKTAIVLAVYNGEQFLEKQIDSILRSDYQNFDIYIRDDGSTDKTSCLLFTYQKKFPHKIFLLNTENENRGACNNFMILINYVSKEKHYDYIMCCDQDDIWHRDKIAVSIKAIRNLEEIYGKTVPLLVHSDLKVINQNENLIADSFFKYSGLNREIKSFHRLLAYNNVTGCTMIMNSCLALNASVVHSDVYMHDWWFALYASAFGNIKCINAPLIDYRQHAHNTLGAQEYRNNYILLKKTRKFYSHLVSKETLMDKSIRQAKLFEQLFGEYLDNKNLKLLKRFVSLKRYAKWKRLFIFFRYRFFSQGTVRIIGQIIYLCITGKELN